MLLISCSIFALILLIGIITSVHNGKNDEDIIGSGITGANDELAEVYTLDALKPESRKENIEETDIIGRNDKPEEIFQDNEEQEYKELKEKNTGNNDEESYKETSQTIAVVKNMSLEEKIYQLFIVTPEQLTGESGVTVSGKTTKKALLEKPVAGIIYMSGNLHNPEQTLNMISNTKEYVFESGGIPLFICIDEEGGKLARIARNPAFNVKNVGSMSKIDS